MPLAFREYSHYYDLLYADKDYDGEVRYILSLLAAQNISGGRLLELGSGTGKHGRLLGEAGFSVHGIERSSDMVAQAATTPSFTCEQGDIRHTRVGKTFDAVLSLFHVISYLTEIEDLREVLSRAREHLTNGGVFIFDVWYTPAVLAQQPEVRVKRVADRDCQVLRIAEPESYPNDSRVDVKYSIFVKNRETGQTSTFEEVHAMRHFTLTEIDLLTAATGFERIGAEEFGTGAAPGTDTWGVCFTLKAIGR